jgi:hypothetical protein
MGKSVFVTATLIGGPGPAILIALLLANSYGLFVQCVAADLVQRTGPYCANNDDSIHPGDFCALYWFFRANKAP